MYKLKQRTSSIVSQNKVNLFKQIKQLQNYFVITYVDKPPNNYAFICKMYYHELLNNIISSNNNFKLLKETSVVKN